MRIVIDVERELLEKARRTLGTSAVKETVNAALRMVVERETTRDAFESLRSRDWSALLRPAGRNM
ncbi:type II toxin-antitoxin system VapB family antitoxin [Streptosporangium sp. KLBMP 9127]|nr:type II toxin-antitoxin system VapB family antitoxin [Streptosporangium sp. KLBMP 9127]